jgi:hypothetical protein
MESQRMAEIQRQEEEARRQQQIMEQQQAAEALRQQQEADRLQQQQAEELRQQQEFALQQQQQQVAMQQQQAMMQQQQTMQQQQMSSSVSSTRVEKTTASSEDLEWQKRKEYEDWFKNQEKEALEYSAVCEYQEKAGESREITTKTTTTSSRESHLTRQQHQTQGFLSSTGAAPPLTREAQHGKPPTPTGPLTHTNQTHSRHTNIKQQSSSSMTQQSSSFSHMEGVIKGQDYSRPQQVEDYTSSFQPTTTGDIIRQGGDVVYSKARSESQEPGKSPLRHTPAGQNIRDSGIFGGITGDKNSLVEGSDEIDYTKHTVKQLASHFSKVKPPTEITD